MPPPRKLLIRLFEEETCFSLHPLLTYYEEDPNIIINVLQNQKSDVGKIMRLTYSYSFCQDSKVYSQTIQAFYFGIHCQFKDTELNQNEVNDETVALDFAATTMPSALEITPTGCVEINFVFATGQFEQFMSEMLYNQNSIFLQEATPLL